MWSRRVLGLLCGVAACTACGDTAHESEPDADTGGLVGDSRIDCPPGDEPDGGVPDDSGTPDGEVDAAIDAGVDAAPDGPSDLTAPTVLTIQPAPTTAIWLHEPICITFDEAVDATAAQVSVHAGTQTIAATLGRSGPNALVIQIDPAAHALGALTISLDGVTDIAGNAITAPISASYDLPTWLTASLAPTPAHAIAVGASGEVVTATLGTGVTVARRAPGGWVPLGSAVGSAPTAVALAVDDTEQPVVAWAEGATITVAHWDGAAWAVSPVGALAAAPTTLAVDAAGNVVGGWIASGALHVQRAGGAELTPLAVTGTASNLVLTTRAGVTAVAWEELLVSPGVYAALAAPGATSLTRLAAALDVDIAGAATRPSIALDATGAPIVAWREQIETAERGVLARWTGTAWSPGGPRSWLPASPSADTPRLALHAGQTPVLALGASLVELNAAPDPVIGIASRTPLTGCAFDPAAPPARLLATGCFTVPTPGGPVPHAGLVPYDVNVELWSDGTKKRRWIALPTGSMTVTSTGSYDGPAGTFVLKEFALETRPGDASSRRVVETRVFVRTTSGWTGFSYQWRTDGTDADLLTDGQWTKDWARADGTTYRHVYPSRSQCNSCHEGSFGPLLGLRADQLTRFMDYDGVIADQVATLASIGIGPATTAPRLASPHDATLTVETRMRGYAAANCAHCHNPNHIAVKDLRFSTPLAQTKLCASVVPGSPAQSVFYQKINSRPGMPALGTLAVDPLATQLVGAWITSLTSCP